MVRWRFSLLWFLPVLAGAQALRYEKTEGGVLIREGNQNVLFYQAQTTSMHGRYSRAHYIHPLYGLDGSILTEDFPGDHPHHRGVFWAWHQVLIQGKHIGDSWECRNFNWIVKSVDVKETKAFIELHATVQWTSPEYTDSRGAHTPFLQDNSIIRVFPRVDNYRVIDIEISLNSLVEQLALGGSEDAKGYGGFSIRLKMPPDLQFSSGEGAISPTEAPVNAANWMNISGSIGGEGKPGGVLIITRKPRLQGKYPWIIRRSGSMQNAVFPGREAVSLNLRQPTLLCYRLLVYSGLLSHEKIRELLPEAN